MDIVSGVFKKITKNTLHCKYNHKELTRGKPCRKIFLDLSEQKYILS